MNQDEMNEIVVSLVKKVQDNTSTPEEELLLMDYMNNSITLLREIVKAIKVEQLKKTISKSN